MNYRKQVEHFFEVTLDTMYPVRRRLMVNAPDDYRNVHDALINIMECNIETHDCDEEDLCTRFQKAMPGIKAKLDKDIEAIYNGDPAAVNDTEIIIAYPGFYAVAAYRVAHWLLQQQVPLIPRIITEHAHSVTGIDIHPGAIIGEYLCIDHGTGVVIGETAVIGDHVKIYQGVTLGALSIEQKHIPGQRHPTIEDHVVIYAQATILGGKTVIGKHSVIGGNVWLIKSVPPFSKIYYSGQGEIISHS